MKNGRLLMKSPVFLFCEMSLFDAEVRYGYLVCGFIYCMINSFLLYLCCAAKSTEM